MLVLSNVNVLLLCVTILLLVAVVLYFALVLLIQHLEWKGQHKLDWRKLEVEELKIMAGPMLKKAMPELPPEDSYRAP